MNATAVLRRRALLASAAALVMQGCASVGAPGKGALNIRPAANSPPPSMSDSDAFYGSAVAAIDQRDYARALDLLQAARARAPGDVRVLNAFGVVYDKLGRFDLSQRYYAQAQTVEPTSAIVAQNLAYSRTLQGDAAAVTLAEAGDPLSHATAPRIERAVPSPQALLRHEPPAIAIAQAAPAKAAAAPVSSPRPQPAVIVSPASVATASEPFVVRLKSVIHDKIEAPRAVRITLPQFAPAHAPAKLASAPSAPQAEPKLTLASNAAAVRPASSSRQTPSRPKAAAAPRTAPVAVATRIQTPSRVPPIAPVVSSSAITKAVVRTPPRGTAAGSAKSIISAQPTRARTLLGRPVTVIYSNTSRRDAERLRTQLGRRGWTLAVASRRTPPPRMTVVRYDAGSQRVALALVRSLRIPVRLERCRAQCSGVSIILGGRSALRMATAGDHGRTLG